MPEPRFTLALVTSADGFIARTPGEPPQAWGSAEEQDLFFAEVAAAEWSIMGRHTHEAADRPERRRIILSTGAGGWRRPTQLWLNPEKLGPSDLAARAGAVHPMRNALILGGTRVHDWFHAAGAIDIVKLTVEPISFGAGLPVFSGQAAADPVQVFQAAGYRAITDEPLNAGGTRLVTLRPRGAAEG
jgi:dihydrofolate reductase